jgi:hypothetical protein
MIALLFSLALVGLVVTVASPVDPHGDVWLHHEIATALVSREEPLSASAPFEKGWKDALLFQYGA